MASKLESLIRRAGELHLYAIGEAFRERPYSRIKAEVKALAKKGKVRIEGEIVKAVRA